MLGVFQGGGCRGAAYIGAYAEAVANGVNFSEVAGTSAGSIVAALIGAGASPEYVKDRVEALDYSKFLLPFNPPKEIAARGKVQKMIASTLSSSLQLVSKAYYEGAIHCSQYIEDFVNESLRARSEIKLSGISGLA